MPRPKTGIRQTRGVKPWIYGTKLIFFESRKAEWQGAIHRGKPGTFYTHITKLYLLKYGDMDLKADLTEDIDDPEDDTFELDDADLTEAERKEKQASFKKLRTVSTYSFWHA